MSAFSSYASICGDILISCGPRFSPYGDTVNLSRCFYSPAILTLCVNPQAPRSLWRMTMGYEYIDNLAWKKKQEFPGCDGYVDQHVSTIKQRLGYGEYSDAYSAESDFLDLVRWDSRIRK